MEQRKLKGENVKVNFQICSPQYIQKKFKIIQAKKSKE